MHVVFNLTMEWPPCEDITKLNWRKHAVLVLWCSDYNCRATCSSMLWVNTTMEICILHDIINVGDYDNVHGTVDVSKLLGKIHERLRYWCYTIYAVFCTRFTNNDTIINVGWSILKTLIVCLHIGSSFATGQLYCVHAESRTWMVHIFGVLFTDPIYTTPTSMQIKMFISSISLALIIADTIILSCFLLHTNPNDLHWTLKY